MNPPTCAHHPLSPAIAICTECDGDICAPCHGMDLRGFAICSPCRAKYGPMGTPWEMPATRWALAAFVHTLRDAIMAPRTFFVRLAPDRPAASAAVFGIVCIATGTFFGTLWQMLFVEEFAGLLERTGDQFGIDVETARIYVFASIPIAALFKYVLHVMLLFGALKILGARVDATLAMRIVGFSSAAYLFLLVPPLGSFPLGHFLMLLWFFNLEIGAVRWFFNLGMWKSMAAVLIPFLFILLLGG